MAHIRNAVLAVAIVWIAGCHDIHGTWQRQNLQIDSMRDDYSIEKITFYDDETYVSELGGRLEGGVGAYTYDPEQQNLTLTTMSGNEQRYRAKRYWLFADYLELIPPEGNWRATYVRVE